MEEKELQNYLYKKRVKLKQDLRPLLINKVQRQHIRTFISKNSGLLKMALGLLFVHTLIEIFIPLISDFYIKKYAYFLEIDKLIYAISGLALLLAGYLVISFYSIKAEKSFILYFLNDLRHKWFALYLNKPKRNLKGSDKGKLFTKISYHFSLLQIGISNSIFPAFNWLFLSVGLIVSSFILQTNLLIVVLISLPLSIFVGFIGYVISKYYVSQDQTLYSKILRFVNDSLEEFDSVKVNRKEIEVLKKFDKMVDLDTYFRIRRDLWLKYGGKIMFVMISLAVAGLYLFEIYHPFLQAESSAQYVVFGIFFALIIKLFYLSLRIGLFSYPAILGTALCVPDTMVSDPSKKEKKLEVKTLILKSTKVKLARAAEYSKNVEFQFTEGDRVLIQGKAGSGKSTIAEVLSGQISPSRARAWGFKFNGARLLYSKWHKICRSVYYISSSYRTEQTLLHNFSTSDENILDERTMQKLIDVFQYKHFKFLLDNGRAIGRTVDKNSFSPVEMMLMQMAYALHTKPPILIIDNLWLDIDDVRINESLQMLSESLPKTIIVCLANKKNTLLNYDQEYSI
jgi:ABC-type transport system involved in cytochrome bd biosynthesis fused ATPase/permease subunit